MHLRQPSSDGDPVLRVAKSGDGAYFIFSYGDGARFAVDQEGREIWADWPDRDYTLETQPRISLVRSSVLPCDCEVCSRSTPAPSPWEVRVLR